MAEQNFPDRVLYNLDNLEALRGMNSETVDLIATDPPFNKKRNRSASAGQYEDAWRWADHPSMIKELPDQWKWQPVHRIWLDQIRDENEALFQVIEATRLTQDDDTAAFLCWLGVRLLEMRRVLKPTGSIYLHCDHTANGYIRMVMDAIFRRHKDDKPVFGTGQPYFRNEIVWRRYGSHNDAKRYGQVHDTLFFYSKTAEYVWTGEVYDPYEAAYIAKAYRNRDEKGAYTTSPLQARSLSGGGYHFTWRGITDIWKFPKERLDELEREGMIHWPKRGRIPRRKVYFDPAKGIPPSDVITEAKPLAGAYQERTTSPDQKPIALYERIIRASSNPDDIVLDPFCGCATTPIAANNLGRRWVGIDRREDAAYHIANRLLGLGINVNEFKAEQQWLLEELQDYCEIRATPPSVPTEFIMHPTCRRYMCVRNPPPCADPIC